MDRFLSLSADGLYSGSFVRDHGQCLPFLLLTFSISKLKQTKKKNIEVLV